MSQGTVYKHILQIAIVPVLAYKLLVEGLFLHFFSPVTGILLILHVLSIHKHNTTWKWLMEKWKDSWKNRKDKNKEE
ncbi:hypothetical protein ACQUY5_23665 [Bacillus cereus]|uniref:hypothetical protein n=1 Tax=Bacillus cereus TaxID=1396 RepID=UPI003D185844